MNLNDVLSHHVQSRLRSFKFLLLERHWIHDPYDSQDLLRHDLGLGFGSIY